MWKCKTRLTKNDCLTNSVIFGESRRQFLRQVSAAGSSVLAIQTLAEQNAFAAVGEIENAVLAQIENAVKAAFKVNGAEKSLNVDSRTTLWDALRERMQLTGSKRAVTTVNAVLAR